MKILTIGLLILGCFSAFASTQTETFEFDLEPGEEYIHEVFVEYSAKMTLNGKPMQEKSHAVGNIVVSCAGERTSRIQCGNMDCVKSHVFINLKTKENLTVGNRKYICN